MRFFWTFCAILGLSNLAHANDGVSIGNGGRWRFLKGEHRQIQMVRERVTMTIGPKENAEIVADFVFKNEGPKTSVVMGFPESSGGVDFTKNTYKNKSAFVGFKSWVDGRRVAVKRVFDYQHHDFPPTLWIKTVVFARNQTRRVRVRYLTPGGYDSTGFSSHSYNFTGGNWMGHVEESVLQVRFQIPGSWQADSYSGKTKPTVKQKNNNLEFRWQNWQAEEDFSFRYQRTLRGTLGGKIGDFRLDVPQKFQRGVVLETVDVPPGVREGRNIWVNTEWLCEPLATRPYKDGTEITDQIDRSWDKKTQVLTLQRGQKIAKISLGEAVKNSDKTPHHAGVPFYVRDSSSWHLYVPVSALKPLKLALPINTKTNQISKRGLQ